VDAQPDPRSGGRDGTTLADDATDAALLASRALVGVAARSLAAIEPEITLRQYRALVLLGSRGEQNVGSLADALEVHPSTITRLCDRLLAKQLIERTVSKESRREVSVRLSSTGRALLRGVTNRRRKDLGRIMGRLEADERSAVLAAFSAFAAAAGEAPDDAWKLGWTS
jgi:DNA-binding MarR family transcriptional regulator